MYYVTQYNGTLQNDTLCNVTQYNDTIQNDIMYDVTQYNINQYDTKQNDTVNGHNVNQYIDTKQNDIMYSVNLGNVTHPNNTKFMSLCNVNQYNDKKAK